MDIFRLALSLVIHKNGLVTEQDADELLDRYRIKKGIHIERDKFWQTIQLATAHYNRNEQCLFVCTNVTCLKKTYLNPSDVSLQLLSEEIGCPVEATGCHWQCESGPVVTLKQGTASRSFLNCSTQESWESARHEIATLTENLVKACC